MIVKYTPDSTNSNTTYSYSSSDFTISQSSTTSTNYSFRVAQSQGCNESKKHNNEEKAFYHGLKSAYRMSRPYDGEEYGTDDPPYETATRIAANVAIAFFEQTDNQYTREESMEYLRENIVSDPNTIDRVLDLLGLKDASLEAGNASSLDLEAGIDQAWTQVDDKWNHYDAARTALAIAEAYLGERLYESTEPTNSTSVRSVADD